MKTEYTLRPQKVITGIRADIIRMFVQLQIARLVFTRYKNPLLCLKIFRKLVLNRREFSDGKIRKIVCVDGSYHWDLYIPGSNSKALQHFFLGESNRICPCDKPSARFVNVLICITKQCPLKCEHCYEWDALNNRETLTLNDIKTIVGKFQEQGTGQIQLTGGEPMMKVDEMVEILSTAKAGSEFWMFTSGYNLSRDNALKLKRAGLTGVVVSLDHFAPYQHNLFRGSSKSFEWAQIAVKSATEARLVTALSLCVTPSFASESNLMTYAELARKMGVSFIQLLEPRATGHYSGREVGLNEVQLKMLDHFYHQMNFTRKYREYPIICYHGHYQRKVGCFGAGNRSVYVDTDGDFHACPFCRSKMGSVLTDDFEQKLTGLMEAGCHKFERSLF